MTTAINYPKRHGERDRPTVCYGYGLCACGMDLSPENHVVTGTIYLRVERTKK